MSARVAYRNLADNGTLTLSLGSQLSGYPIQNAQIRQLSQVGRVKRSAGLVRITVDLGAAFDINIIAIMGMNHIRGGVPGAYPADFRASHSLDNISYSSGILSSTDVTLDSALLDIVNNTYLLLDTRVSARYVRIDFSWPVDASAEMYEFGRIWVGDSIVFPQGVVAQFDLDFIDNGSVEESQGLQAYENREQRVRVMKCTFPEKDIDSNVAFGYDGITEAAFDVPSLQGLQLDAGLTGEVILLPRGDDAIYIRRLGIYGHIPSSGKPVIRHVKGGYYSCSLTVIEER